MEGQESLDADIAGQKLSIKTNSLNTVATVATLIIVTVLGYILFTHGSETKDASRELASALRDMVQATREQNCLIGMAPDDRPRNAEFCKRIAR